MHIDWWNWWNETKVNRKHSDLPDVCWLILACYDDVIMLDKLVLKQTIAPLYMEAVKVHWPVRYQSLVQEVCFSALCVDGKERVPASVSGASSPQYVQHCAAFVQVHLTNLSCEWWESSHIWDMRALTLKLSCVRTNSSRSVLGGRFRLEQDSWNQPHLYYKSEETLISSFISEVFYMSFNLLAACVSVFCCQHLCLPPSFLHNNSICSLSPVMCLCLCTCSHVVCAVHSVSQSAQLFHGSGAGSWWLCCYMHHDKAPLLGDHVVVLHLFINIYYLLLVYL